jgi:hypothetical protein
MKTNLSTPQHPLQSGMMTKKTRRYADNTMVLLPDGTRAVILSCDSYYSCLRICHLYTIGTEHGDIIRRQEDSVMMDRCAMEITP